ncbi:hypothetical protein F4809DRAFT_654693 [Biscogniauxia mediterranea]|nr:hypothetical protein F4809DRAFT_654693 [Biscogniauxia mediterranea]
MKVFAVLAALASASALAFPAGTTSLESRSDVLHDLLLNVTSAGEDSAVIDVSYEPGVDYYELLGLSSTSTLRPRTDVNIPGIGERITVAFRIASVTLIRTAANILEVEIDNLVDYTITVALNWFTDSETERVPARGTAEHNINIPGNGEIRVTASRFS